MDGHKQKLLIANNYPRIPVRSHHIITPHNTDPGMAYEAAINVTQRQNIYT